MEESQTNEAKYAHSVDKLATLLHGVELPGLVYQRFLKLGGSLEDVRQYNLQYMKWDSFLFETGTLCFEQVRRHVGGEELLFLQLAYDIAPE